MFYYVDPHESCRTCNSAQQNPANLEDYLNGFDEKEPTEKLQILKDSIKRFHECHWIVNKIADMITKEFCTDPEYTRNIPGLIVDFKTGLIRGSETISNPFVLVNRYEYALALINRHPELYRDGLLIASNYLKLAARIKGIDDDLAQKFAIISKNWSDYLNRLNP